MTKRLEVVNGPAVYTGFYVRKEGFILQFEPLSGDVKIKLNLYGVVGTLGLLCSLEGTRTKEAHVLSGMTEDLGPRTVDLRVGLAGVVGGTSRSSR